MSRVWQSNRCSGWMNIDTDALERNLMVIKKLQKMNDSELEAFMEEFVKTLGDKRMNPNKLSFFLQLLIQMDPRLAKRFMEAVSEQEKDEPNGQ